MMRGPYPEGAARALALGDDSMINAHLSLSPQLIHQLHTRKVQAA